MAAPAPLPGRAVQRPTPRRASTIRRLAGARGVRAVSLDSRDHRSSFWPYRRGADLESRPFCVRAGASRHRSACVLRHHQSSLLRVRVDDRSRTRTRGSAAPVGRAWDTPTPDDGDHENRPFPPRRARMLCLRATTRPQRFPRRSTDRSVALALLLQDRAGNQRGRLRTQGGQEDASSCRDSAKLVLVARKARLGRNPQTGEPITIPANASCDSPSRRR